jgi:hypothetical protein
MFGAATAAIVGMTCGMHTASAPCWINVDGLWLFWNVVVWPI